jgi:hypothetical protein
MQLDLPPASLPPASPELPLDELPAAEGEGNT